MTNDLAGGNLSSSARAVNSNQFPIARMFDLFGVLDESGNIITLEGEIFSRTAADPAMLAGQPFAESVFWQSTAANSRLIENALRDTPIGGRKRLVIDFRIAADETAPFELRILAFSDAGQRKQFLVAGCEIEQQLPDSTEVVAELLNAADAGEIGLLFWNHKENGRAYANRFCNSLCEMPSNEELRVEILLEKIHPDDRSQVSASLSAAIASGRNFEEEFRFVYSDGTVEWICAQGKSFLARDGKPAKTLAVLRKTTEAKNAADELERIYEREKRARDEAETANRAKDFFLAFVSHELRSPLNAILGWSKILLTREVNEETRRKALETIEKSAQVQAKLINDLVDSARVASGKLRLEYRPVNIVEIVRSSFEALRPTAEAAGLKYEFHSELSQKQILGDSGRLQQVFGNLISNAVKFTPSGGTVNVTVREDGDFIEISVTDTGHGIEPALLPNIFRQFAQGHPENERRSGGLGLGLSIVNILVGKHGGSVSAFSDGHGRGSCFTVRLPATGVESVPVNKISTPANNVGRLDGIKILIVEDDPDSREVLQLFLEQNGASANAVDSVRQALAVLKGNGPVKYDLIISDLAMPEEDGYSLIKKIRSNDENDIASIPAIALSAFTTQESRSRALEAGFQRYLTKPFEPEAIVREILALLQNKDKFNQ